MKLRMRKPNREKEKGKTNESDVFFAGNSVEKVEIDDLELLQFLDQFDDVPIR